MQNGQYSKPANPYRVHGPLRRCPEACPSVFDPTVTDAQLEQSLVDGLADSEGAKDPFSISRHLARLSGLEADENRSAVALLGERMGNAPTADEFIFLEDNGKPV